MINRKQIRDLLRPGIYEAGADRGIPFDDEEADAVIDAYCNHGHRAAFTLMQAYTAMPARMYLRQRHLGTLKSVTRAYRDSQIPLKFRNRKETSHDDRQSS